MQTNDIRQTDSRELRHPTPHVRHVWAIGRWCDGRCQPRLRRDTGQRGRHTPKSRGQIPFDSPRE